MPKRKPSGKPPVGNSLWCRKYTLKKRYGITYVKYLDMCARVGNVCEICKGVGDRGLSVDHNHTDGSIRGILCNRCNMGLGSFKDQARLLMEAAWYLMTRP